MELQKDPSKLATFNRISDRESFKKYLTTANITLRDELGSYKFSERYFDLNFNPGGAIAKKISDQMVAEAQPTWTKTKPTIKKTAGFYAMPRMKRGADRMGRVTGDLNRRFGSEVTSPGIAPQAATFL